jgi:hypothetical protein
MATNDTKDQVYPKVAHQTISAFSADTSFPVLKGSKVSSLVSAINARTQTQHSPVQFKQNMLAEQTRKASENFQTEVRTSSYSSHEIQPQTLNKRLEHEIPDRFNSEFSGDELEPVPALSVAMTRSLGRNDFLRLKPDLHRNFGLPGEVISSNISFRTVGPVSSSLKVIPRGKVESNPFFQLDRQRTNLKQVQSPVCTSQSNFSTTSVNRRDHVNDSMSIKMRIKLWSEMEVEVKPQQVPIERRKSAHFPISYCEAVPPRYHKSNMVSADQTIQRSTSMSSLHIDTTERVVTEAISDVSAEIETQTSASPLDHEDQLPIPFVHLDSDNVGKGGEVKSDAANQKESAKRSVKDSSSGISKGLSKLSTKLSPRFHRKKLESVHQGDKDPAKGIGGRSSKKRKAFKGKGASVTNTSNCTPAELVLKPGSDANIQSKPANDDDDDDVFAFEELNQRSNSVNEKSRKSLIITKNRAESQPIDPQQLNLTSGMQVEVDPSILNGANLNIQENKLKGDAINPEFLHSKVGHSHPETKDRSVYGGACEVINSLVNANDLESRISDSGESSSDGEPYTCTATFRSGIYSLKFQDEILSDFGGCSKTCKAWV